MKPIDVHRGVAAPMRQPNIDTDAIIPSREMKRVSKLGLGDGMFAAWRYSDVAAREPNAEFVLNRPEYRETSILLAGRNFGCGSSREHAVWALDDYGIRVIIAPSFGAIFQKNCYRNGLLAVVLDDNAIEELVTASSDDPETALLEVDLTDQSVLSPSGLVYPFQIAEAIRHRLLEGADEIDQTLQYRQDIERFRDRRVVSEPWVGVRHVVKPASSDS